METDNIHHALDCLQYAFLLFASGSVFPTTFFREILVQGKDAPQEGGYPIYVFLRVIRSR